jgi:putative ABC transport system permease protein
MRLWADLVARVQALFHRSQEEREMEEEFLFHIDMQADALRKTGMDDARARRQAARTFGGKEQVKEDMRDGRGTRLFEDALSDFTLSLRTLRQTPRFTVVAVLTIAIGIGGTTAVFSAVNAVLLQPLPYQQPGQLLRLYQIYAGHEDALSFVSMPQYQAYRSDLSSFDALATVLTYSRAGADIKVGDRPERLDVLPVSADYFRVLGVQPMLGRAFERTEETDVPLVILSYRLWQRLFGGRRDAVGSSLTMSGIPRTIIGVMPAAFTDPLVAGVDAWVPQDLRPVNGQENEQNHFLSVIGRLRPGVTLARAQSELDVTSASLGELYPRIKDEHALIFPLKDDLVGPVSRSLELMLGAVGLVLLLACVNVANLLLVRASERSRELALRSALGARRGRLTRQLLTESVVLAGIGGVAGLGLGRALMPVVSSLGASSIPRVSHLTLNWPVLAFACVMSSASAIVFGLVPAMRGARADAMGAMREQAQATTTGRSLGQLRSALVVSQVALALVLLVGAGLLLATVNQLRRTNLGVSPDNVLTFDVSLPAARYDSTARAHFYENFAQAVSALPGVRAAGAISRLPVTGHYHSWGAPEPLTGPLAGVAEHARQIDEADNRVVSGDYFKAVGIHITRGRTFDPRDVPTAPQRVVISASVARQAFPGVDPIGQRVSVANKECDVIGVVNDVAYDVEGHTTNMVYHAHTQYAGDRNWALTQVVAVNGDPVQMESGVRRVLASMDPLLVMYQPATLDAVIGQGRAERIFTLRILAAFACVAVVLAGLGLFGVLSYAVRLRSKEIGIRIALGADRATIRSMVLRDGALVTAIGVAVGLAGAVVLSRLIASMIFGVSPLDPVVLVGATVFLMLVAGIAAYLPAQRASTLAPQRVLQGD